jgi:hypothetical protein
MKSQRQVTLSGWRLRQAVDAEKGVLLCLKCKMYEGQASTARHLIDLCMEYHNEVVTVVDDPLCDPCMKAFESYLANRSPTLMPSMKVLARRCPSKRKAEFIEARRHVQ